LVASRGQAKRDLLGGGVRLDGETVTDPHHHPVPRPEGSVLQKGKRHYVRLMAEP
jgi:tyrosyl-tRNA synthetase